MKIELPNYQRLAALCLLVVLSGCAALKPGTTPQPAFYTLEGRAVAQAPAHTSAGPTLVVALPAAAAGFESQRIIYVREPHHLEYFAHSEWVEPPARMIAAALLAALQNSPAFSAVVPAAGSATGELRLDTELVRLQHEFRSKPSQVVLVLRATVVDDKTRRVLAMRQFEAQVASTSEDPQGGVVAANLALQRVLAELSAFCAEAASTLPHPD